MLENSPTSIETNACAWLLELAGSSECPSFINDPSWIVILEAILFVVAIYCLWPMAGPILTFLYGVWARFSARINNVNIKLREFVRTTYVTTIEQTTGSTVFVSKDKALSIIRESDFAKNASIHGQEPKTFHDLVSLRIGTPPKEKAMRHEYNAWLDLALRRFEEDAEEDAAIIRKNDDGETEYSETALRRWLEEKWQDKIQDRFGEI